MPTAATRQVVLLWVMASDVPDSMPSALVKLREGPLSLEGSAVKSSSRAVIFRNA